MDFRAGPLRFAAALGLRAMAIGGLGFLAIWLAVARDLYATAVVVMGVAALVVVDVVRQLTAADRLFGRFIDGLIAEGDERPAPATSGMPGLDEAMARALERVGKARSERQRRIDYLQTLADTVSAALLVIDEDDRVEIANHAARRILPPAKRLSDLGEDIGRRLAVARPGAGEVVRLADGRAMFAQVTGFSTPEGGPRRLISLQRLSGDLDAVELRAWEDLVRVLSHEIMNSLTPILSLAESSKALLAKSDGEAAQALEIIARRSAGLMTFVERYREVFDIPKPDRKRMALGELLSRVDGLMAGGGALVSRCEAPRAMVAVDPALMDQAIINLLKNALEAVRGQAGGAVSLTGRIEGERALIEVADNGPGLLPEDVETAFVPFFSRKPDGSGIGLSVARHIVIAHDGTIEYVPARGGGAMFRISLPLA